MKHKSLIKACLIEKKHFIQIINSLEWDPALRKVCEDLIIMYDTLINELGKIE